MKSGMALAERIHLGRKLFAFYDDVKYFPSWYLSPVPYPADQRWGSNVILKSAITRVKTSELKSFGIEVPDYEHDELLYRFTTAGKDYVFIARGDQVPSWVEEVEDEPSWPFHAVRLYVIELPAKVVLEDRIVYRSGSYTDDYHSDYLESFRPGEWLVTVFRVADAVRTEAEAKHRMSSERFEEERARKFS
jgi:hypothetical protein